MEKLHFAINFYTSEFLPPATKLRQGNVSTPVYDSVHKGSLSRGSLSGGSLSRGSLSRGSLFRGASVQYRGVSVQYRGLCPGRFPIQLCAGSMHSTGKHSCYKIGSLKYKRHHRFNENLDKVKGTS